METLISFKDILVTRSETRLVIGNCQLRREFDLSIGAPVTRSLRSEKGLELSSPEKRVPDLGFIGMHPAGYREDIPWQITGISAKTVEASFLDSEHVLVSVSMREEVSKTEYFREYMIYPDFPAISVRNSICPKVFPILYWSRRGELADLPYRPDIRESMADSLLCADGFIPVKAVSFIGRTDAHDEVVQEHPADLPELNGNLLFCENASGAGFLYLQEAPPSGERRDLELCDFTFRNGLVSSCSWGIHPSDLRLEEICRGYRHDLLVYHSAQERDFLLKEFLRKRFPPKPYSVMVNSFGCGRFPSLISESFLIEDIRAAAEVGATHYQIDDAWQEGGALPEIMVKNRHVTLDFWQISRERLSGTFAPVMDAARDAGIEPALWVVPSCNLEYRDWKCFAERLLELYRQYDIRIFKVDAIMIRSCQAEQNLRSLLEFVRERTDGRVSFNLDTTNGQRPGYFLFLEYGNIFLENRFVCNMHGRGYHPEKTLRSIWRLSGYMRLQELQVEVPCAGDINPAFYATKPWCPPETYSQEYWAAIALFANPLLWFAPSIISQENRAAVRRIMDLHRSIRDAVFAGEIEPVGQCPDGKAFTGFHSHHAGTGKDFAVFYREAGAEADSAEMILPWTRNEKWKILAGAGRVSASASGRLEIRMPRASFLLLESE